MDKDLIKNLTIFLANDFSLYYLASAFHWNVEGEDFYELHLLFEKIYTDVYDQIDVVAEKIRMVKGYPPTCPVKLLELSSIGLDTRPESAYDMVKILEKANVDIQAIIMNVFNSAQAVNNQAVMNYCAERLDKHAKWAWMLRATGKIKD
jgi:starvation-inducible DNA-binding protein